MSLMGYTDVDVIKMKEAITTAHKYLPMFAEFNGEVIEGLQEAIDFLEGLLIEGRV